MKLHVNQNILLTGKTSTTIINDSLSNKTMRRSCTSHLKNKHFRVFLKTNNNCLRLAFKRRMIIFT